MFVCIHCITAKTIETVPGHYTSWRPGLAPVPAEPGQGMQVSSEMRCGKGCKKKKPFGFCHNYSAPGDPGSEKALILKLVVN